MVFCYWTWFSDYIHLIYPNELEAWSKGYYWHSKVWFSTWSSPWNRQWRKTNYNKHDDLTSPKVGKLLFISSNISATPEYRMEFTFHNSFIIYSCLGLVSSTVICFWQSSVTDANTNVLLKQGYVVPRSKSSLLKLQLSWFSITKYSFD